MPQNNRIFLQILTYCMLIGVTYAIIGDKVRVTKKGECPYVVSISDKALYANKQGNLHFCTGTLVKKRSVLTAAHCLKDKKPSEVVILAGSGNLLEGKQYQSERWITYEKWKTNRTDSHPFFNDIAVIIGEGIQDIQPVNVWTIPDKNLNNENIKIVGWGNLISGRQPFQLRTAILQLISNQECTKQGAKLKGDNFVVPPNCFCSKADPYVLSTSGDGGAPIIIRKKFLIGINIGVCPKLEGNFSSEFLHQNQLNSHLHIRPYIQFLIAVAQ